MFAIKVYIYKYILDNESNKKTTYRCCVTYTS